MKRLKDNSDAPEARYGTLPKTSTSSNKKDMATFHSPAKEWVLSVAETKKARGKRVCGRFRSKYAYGHQERL